MQYDQLTIDRVHQLWAAAGYPDNWYVSQETHAMYERALMGTVGRYTWIAINGDRHSGGVMIEPVPREMQLPEGF